MDPIAFTLFGHDFRWYGVMAATGVMAAYLLLRRNRRMAGLSEERVADIMFVTLISGIAGARLFYVLQFWNRFIRYKVVAGVRMPRTAFETLIEIFRIDHGGLVFYGGFLCAVAALFIYCRRKKIDFLRFADAFVPSLAIGHAFGRIGCFINGCCYGKTCSWGFHYPEKYNVFPGHGVYPVQIFESACEFAACILLLFLLGKMRKGRLSALYVIIYGIVRFSLEFIRGDHTDFLFGVLTEAQCVSIVAVPAAAYLFWRCGRNPVVAPNPEEGDSEKTTEDASNSPA